MCCKLSTTSASSYAAFERMRTLSRPRAEESSQSTLFLVSARITNLCPLAVGERWLLRGKEWRRTVRQVVPERCIKVDVVDAAVSEVVVGLPLPRREEVAADINVGQGEACTSGSGGKAR